MENFNSYDDNKKDGKIYIGKQIINKDGNSYRKAEAISDFGMTYTENVYGKNGENTEFQIKEKIKLYETPTGQQKYWCWLVEDNSENKTTALHICRRASKGNVYNEQEVTLNPHGISVLKNFLEQIKLCNNDSQYKIQTYHNNYNKVISKSEFLKILENNIDSIDDYYNLVSIKKKNNAILELEEIVKGKFKNEVSIQKFLKQNIWLFGNQYCTFVESEKINADNILDAIPKNIEGFIDVIEVKLPNKKLFYKDSNHNNYYSSSDLTKAIAQTQNYIFELEKMTIDAKYQIENKCNIIKPRGIILIGSENELNSEEEKYLRILNSSYHNLQIMTYQQLLKMAKNIVTIEQSDCI